MKNIIFYILIGCLVGYILFFKLGFAPEQPIIKTDTITRVDTIKVEVDKKYSKPAPIKIINAGTEKEIQIYSRTILNDSTGILTLNDSVQHNQLLGYSLKGNLNTIYKYKTITNTITAPATNKVFIGVNIAYTPALVSIYPSVSLVTKKGIEINAGYDLVNKIYYGGVKKQIRFKK